MYVLTDFLKFVNGSTNIHVHMECRGLTVQPNSLLLSLFSRFFNKLYTSKLLESKTCLNMLYVEGMAIIEGERNKELSKEELDSLSALTKSRKQVE